MSNPSTIIQAAIDLQANHNKLEIAGMARGLGWRGDQARAPILQLALFVATKLAAAEEYQQDNSRHETDSSGEADQPDSGEAEQGDSGEADQPEQGDSGEADSGEADQPEQGQQDSGEADQPEQGDSGEADQPEQGQQDSGEADQPEQGDSGEADQPEQGDSGEADQDENEQPEDNDEYRKLLAASGIEKPHKLLEKVWRLSTKAKQNVLLVGPAGSGKTMISEQLSQLLRVPFASVSCTMGMSESQLTGWLLPVEDGGRFTYVESPFVRALKSPSVFLFDELDAADPNVLMLTNSVLSNGFISIPQKHDDPMIKRHADNVIIAGANTLGSGADDIYSARSALDGATLDRFYPVHITYDEDYEHGIFAVEHKSRKKSAAWQRGAAVDQLQYNQLRDWFFALRSKAEAKRINRIVSSRLASRLVAAVKAGIPVPEAQADLLMYWTDDELLSIGFSDVRKGI